MPAMFPGMNPYLEHPDIWPEIHPRFVAALAELLEKEVSERYSIIIRKRVYRVSGEDSLVVGHTTQERSSETSSSSLSSQSPLTSLSLKQFTKTILKSLTTKLEQRSLSSKP